MGDNSKVRISHFGAHYHRPDCRAANPDMTNRPADYFDIDIKDLKQARNDWGVGFRPCGMCNAKEYVKSIIRGGKG